MDVDLGGSYVLLASYAVIALGFSFFCSIAEAVILSVTPSYVAAQERQGDRSAKLLAQLKANIDRPLAAILSLNTIAHTVGAVGVGAEAAALWGSWGIGVASALMTVAILVASEIIPKTIGATHWRALAPATAKALAILVRMLAPLVWLSDYITRAIGGGRETEVVTREEVAAMAGLSSDSGEMPDEETRVVKNMVALKSMVAQDIMTPRTVMIAFSQDITVAELLEANGNLPVSRLPVYDGSIDKVTGFVLKSDVLMAQAQDKHNTVLEELRRDLTAVPASTSLSDLFRILLKEHQHLVLVVDEFGGTDGLVSGEDLIETILGLEIVDEADMAEDMQRLARKQWGHRAKSLDVRKGVGFRKMTE
ncbi:MAG: hemolysin family protein [Pseudomonadales bacterium]